MKPSRRPTLNCPAAYNPSVVSTMTFCINDVNSRGALERANKRTARRPPRGSQSEYDQKALSGGAGEASPGALYRVLDALELAHRVVGEK